MTQGPVDDSTIASLHAALAASQDNIQLRLVLVRAHLERDDVDQALALVKVLRPDGVATPADRLAVAEVLQRSGDPSGALRWLDAGPQDEPRSGLVRARALAALGQLSDAKIAYREAVRQNATLEDPALEAAIQVGGSDDGEAHDEADDLNERGEVRRLRVVANDDTEDTELDRLLKPEPRTVTFADVGGLGEIKKQIEKRIILPFKKPSLFARFKKRVGGGILLYGPPGCGKTLLAQATAGECNAAFYNVGISDILDMYIGESERKLHAMFDKARGNPPAVMFFDELEALGGKRQYTRENTSSKLVSQFLSEMDGFTRDNHGVLVLGATNVPWALDPAFRRPGRFDRVVFVPPPDKDARLAILELLLAERPRAARLDLTSIVRKTSGFSGADLTNIVDAATDLAIEASLEAEDEVPIKQEFLVEALRTTKATTLEWLTTARNYARYANEGGQYDDVLAFLDKHAKGR